MVHQKSPVEIAHWISALIEQNKQLQRRLKSLDETSQSKESATHQKIPGKSKNGSMEAAYGFVGCHVRPKDAAKAEVWGTEAAPARIKAVEGGGGEWEAQPTVGFKPIGYIESCFLDKNGTPRQVEISHDYQSVVLCLDG